MSRPDLGFEGCRVTDSAIAPAGSVPSTGICRRRDEGKCYDDAMKEVKLPKYVAWRNYATWLPGNVERYCLLYRSGF